MKKTISLVFLLFPVFSFAQYSGDTKITGATIKYENDKVIVNYRMINTSHSERFVVWPNFRNEKGQKIVAKTISGDFNDVNSNGEKTIIWDVKNDGVTLNENITVQLDAKQIPNPNLSKALFYSTIFPGAGDYQYKPANPHWIKGALAYGLIGGSYIYYSKYKSSYDNYKTSSLSHTVDPNYNSAKSYRQNSLIMAGVGVGIWLIDYISILSKSSKYKKISSNYVINSSGYKTYSCYSAPIFVNTRSLPPNLYADLEFKDDNGNGILEHNENALLRISLSNQGKGDAMQLQVNVGTNQLDNSFTIQDSIQTINVLKPGERKDIFIPISANLNLQTATHRLEINVSECYGYDMDPAVLVLNTYAYQPPKFLISGYEIIDNGIGTSSINLDGKLQAGEQVKVKLYIQNVGQGIAKNATYNISTINDNIFLDQINGTLGDMNPGEVKDTYFTLSPNKRVDKHGDLPIFINISDEVGRGNLSNENLKIALDQTPPKANIVEVKSNFESLKKNSARFEYTSNKFRTNMSNLINIASVAPSHTKRPKSVGVVIGVSKYKDLIPAPYADNDAYIMKKYFEQVLGVDQVVLFTNDQVSGFIFDDIFNPEVGELKKAITKGVSEVFVFYSGHGIPDKSGSNIYLFPCDGKISRLDSQGYNIEKLHDNLSKLGAKHTTVILDACFSGSSRSSQTKGPENLVGQKGIKLRPKNSWYNDPNFTVISSSTGEETSLGYDESQTGLFTYYFAAGLQGAADFNGDKTITLGELKRYVISNVKETSVKILGQQTPIFYGKDDRVMATY